MMPTLHCPLLFFLIGCQFIALTFCWHFMVLAVIGVLQWRLNLVIPVVFVIFIDYLSGCEVTLGSDLGMYLARPLMLRVWCEMLLRKVRAAVPFMLIYSHSLRLWISVPSTYAEYVCNEVCLCALVLLCLDVHDCLERFMTVLIWCAMQLCGELVMNGERFVTVLNDVRCSSFLDGILVDGIRQTANEHIWNPIPTLLFVAILSLNMFI